MKKLSCILMSTILILQLCAFNVGARVPENPVLIVNGDFSDGTNGWSLRDNASDATYEIAENMGEDGSDCLYVSKSDRSGDMTQTIPTLINAKKGETYFISAKIRLATEGATATAQWGYNENGGYWLGNSNGAHETVTDTAAINDKWTTVSVIFTLQRDYVKVPNYFLVASNSGDKGGYYLDDVILKRVNIGNFVANPNFDYGVAGWKPANATKAITAYKDGDEACAKVTSGEGERSDIQQISGSALKSAKVGDVFYITAKVKVASTNATSTKAGLCLGGWAWVKTNVPVTTEGWTQITATYEVTTSTNIAGAQGLWVVFYDDADSTTEFLVDDVAVIAKDVIAIEGIRVNGVDIPNFDENVMEYTCKVPYGTVEVPTITANVGAYPNGFVTDYTVDDAENLEGVTTLTLTSPDGSQSKSYTIRFQMHEQLTIGDVVYSGNFEQDSNITAKLPITNNSLAPILGSELDITLVVGLYDKNGTLTNIEFASAKSTPNFSIAAGETEELAATINIINTDCKLSAHIIDSFTSHKPLSFMQYYE